MRFLRGVLGFALIACGLLALTDTAHAARRSGLAGSLLIEDKDDLFFFPQLLPQYRNLIALDYGGAANSGNAVLTLGDENSAWGVALHRGDIITPHVINELAALNGPASLFGAPFDASAVPATLIDFLFGTSLGGSSQLGVRLGLGHGSAYTTAGNDDTGESEMFLMGEVGYGTGVRGQDTRFDLSGALSLDLGSQVDDGEDTLSGTHIGASVLLRAFVPLENTLDLGWLGNVAVASNSVTADAAPMEPSASTLAFSAGGGVGPAFRLGPASVAGYGVVRFLYESSDPNSEADDDGSSAHSVIIPGMHVAVEVPISDWLYVRTGAEYAWNLNGTSSDNGPGDDNDTSSSNTEGLFGWNAGLGVVIDDFRFDGSLQHGFVTGGPDFIGGTSPGFFMIAGLSYNFDNARRGVVRAEEEAGDDAEESAAPPPPPEPPASLAPAPPPPPPAPAPEGPEAGVDVGASGGVQFQTTPAPAPPPPAPAPVR